MTPKKTWTVTHQGKTILRTSSILAALEANEQHPGSIITPAITPAPSTPSATTHTTTDKAT